MASKVLIVGAGAVGAFYGALLAKAGAEVATVCRSDYETVRQKGFEINSDVFGGWSFRPSQVLQQITDYQDQADYLILCSKITPGLDRAALIRGGVSEDTVIAFIQNGVAIEHQLAAAFPGHEIISGLAFLCCNRLGPGLIHHLAYGRLTLGNFPHGISERTLQLARLFETAGIECNTTADIVTGRWIKCVWNAAFNPLSVLSGGLSTRAILEQQETFVREIMQEICAIAAASSHPLPADIIDTHIAHTRSMPPYKTSMLLDIEQGRPPETEVILGNAIRAAASAQVACPNLLALYRLMKLHESANVSDRETSA